MEENNDTRKRKEKIRQQKQQKICERGGKEDKIKHFLKCNNLLISFKVYGKNVLESYQLAMGFMKKIF
eukprot:Pgem_evm1s2810